MLLSLLYLIVILVATVYLGELVGVTKRAFALMKIVVIEELVVVLIQNAAVSDFRWHS